MKRTCRKVRATLAMGHESSSERGSIEAHLAECAACRSFESSLQALVVSAPERATSGDEAAILARVHRALVPEIDRATAARARRFAWSLWGLDLRWAGALTLASLLAVGLWSQRDRFVTGGAASQTAQVARRVGDVRLATRVAADHGHREEQGLAVGTQVRTGAQSRMDLMLGRDRVVVGQDSDVVLAALSARETRLHLRRGTVTIEAAPQVRGRKLAVEAPFGTTTVTGTLFEVSTRDGGQVTTWRGVVRVDLVAPGGRSHDVRGGEALADAQRAESGPSHTTRPAPDSFFAAPWMNADRSDGHGYLVVEGTPAGAEVSIDGEPIGTAPLFVRWPSGTHRYLIAASGIEQQGEVLVSAGVTHRIAYALEQDSVASIVKASPERLPGRRGAALPLADGVRSALGAGDCVAAATALGKASRSERAKHAELWTSLAECYLTRREYEKALSTYEDLQQRYVGTPTGENALFEVGRIASLLGRDAAARQAFVRYGRRYPRGMLADDALFRLCALDIEAQRFEQAQRCLAQYRDRFARGAHVGDTVLLEATLRRDFQQDYAGAAKLFARYLAIGSGEKLEEAAYGEVVCLRRLGSPDFEVAAARYLERHPKGKHADEVRGWVQR